jgi:hypothetical protein
MFCISPAPPMRPPTMHGSALLTSPTAIGNTTPDPSAQKYETYQTNMIKGTTTTLRRNNNAHRMANGKGKKNEPSGKWLKEMTADPAPHSAKRMRMPPHLNANLAAFLAVWPIESLAGSIQSRLIQKGNTWRMVADRKTPCGPGLDSSHHPDL